MTDMERLCRAACKAENFAEPDEIFVEAVSGKESYAWEAHIPSVRAVLKELREPTKEMIVRGQGAGYDAPMEDIYKAMIDTILQEADSQFEKKDNCYGQETKALQTPPWACF